METAWGWEVTILSGTTLNVLARLVLGTDGDSLGLGDDYIICLSGPYQGYRLELLELP